MSRAISPPPHFASRSPLDGGKIKVLSQQVRQDFLLEKETWWNSTHPERRLHQKVKWVWVESESPLRNNEQEIKALFASAQFWKIASHRNQQLRHCLSQVLVWQMALHGMQLSCGHEVSYLQTTTCTSPSSGHNYLGKNQRRSVDLGYVDLRGLCHLHVVPTLLRSFCTTQSASFSFSVASLNSQSAAGDFCSVKDGKSVASCNETCWLSTCSIPLLPQQSVQSEVSAPKLDWVFLYPSHLGWRPFDEEPLKYATEQSVRRQGNARQTRYGDCSTGKLPDWYIKGAV